MHNQCEDEFMAISQEMCTDMSKKLKDRLRDPAFYVTTWYHATYPLTFLTHVYVCVLSVKGNLRVAKRAAILFAE